MPARDEQRLPVRILHPDPPLIVMLVPTEPVRGGWYELSLRFSPEGVIDCVAQFVHANGRVVSVLEGGYDLEGLSKSVAAHVTALMRG